MATERFGDDYFKDGAPVDEDNPPTASDCYPKRITGRSWPPQETVAASIDGSPTDIFDYMRIEDSEES